MVQDLEVLASEEDQVSQVRDSAMQDLVVVDSAGLGKLL